MARGTWLWRIFGGEVDTSGDAVIDDTAWLPVLTTRIDERAKKAFDALMDASIEAKVNVVVEGRPHAESRHEETTVSVRVRDVERARVALVASGFDLG